MGALKQLLIEAEEYDPYDELDLITKSLEIWDDRIGWVPYVPNDIPDDYDDEDLAHPTIKKLQNKAPIILTNLSHSEGYEEESVGNGTVLLTSEQLKKLDELLSEVESMGGR